MSHHWKSAQLGRIKPINAAGKQITASFPAEVLGAAAPTARQFGSCKRPACIHSTNPAAKMCMANILCSDKITITLRITQDLVVLSFLTTAYLNMFREKTFTFLLSFAKEESFHKERSKIPLENGMTQDFCCHSKGKKNPNFRNS